MILRYGNYQHALGEASVRILHEALFAPTGQHVATRQRWQIDGVLHGDDPAALTSAIEQLTAAYATADQDLVLLHPDGVTPTAHQLTSAETLSGVRVTRPPSFPEGRGAEYTTFRSYTIELEAELPAVGVGDALLHFEETLAFRGGGPRWIMLSTLAGPPVAQIVESATPYHVTQSGRAVGRVNYPAPAAPLWPAALHADQATVTRRLPHRATSAGTAQPTEYETTWHYTFESATPLVGNPTSGG